MSANFFLICLTIAIAALALFMGFFYVLLNAKFDSFLKLDREKQKNEFLSLSGMIDPLKESLKNVDQKIVELEKERINAYVGLKSQVSNLFQAQIDLAREAKKLNTAMTAPNIRGRWGEMQLKRVIELSGLLPYSDFLSQPSIKDDDRIMRPDLVITLPQNRFIVIDAKAPYESFFDQKEGEESAKELVQAIKRHLLELSKKSYFKFLPNSPEFVVMFIPLEGILSKTLSYDPMLIDFAAQQNIILATPSSLIAMLKAVSFSLKQEAMSKNLEEAKKLCMQLIERADIVSNHFEKLGRSLRGSIECYEQTLSSVENRFLVTAKKLAQMKDTTFEKSEEVLKDMNL